MNFSIQIKLLRLLFGQGAACRSCTNKLIEKEKTRSTGNCIIAAVSLTFTHLISLALAAITINNFQGHWELGNRFHRRSRASSVLPDEPMNLIGVPRANARSRRQRGSRERKRMCSSFLFIHRMDEISGTYLYNVPERAKRVWKNAFVPLERMVQLFSIHRCLFQAFLQHVRSISSHDWRSRNKNKRNTSEKSSTVVVYFELIRIYVDEYSWFNEFPRKNCSSA